ncbi:hypothetical protein [Paractinoplanes lichenicola]|uniref:Uncharacterized protein n=1 Tax=Paractinoplanes lichenicola TaxID=2802976 RepID=A0ABS1VNF8_9ACTN|nr:hypothetical protein [Actinoplanes lichenicola]MBL7255659.1 hypothetical protein [Actinoplanes lichenicola]
MRAHRLAGLVALSLLPIAVPAPAAAAISGERYAYLKAVDPKTRTVTFDVVTWFWGAAATKACREDGQEIPDMEWCNDYYYRNPDTKLHTARVAAKAVVLAVSPRDARRFVPVPLARLRSGPITLRFRDGVVIRVAEVFVP